MKYEKRKDKIPYGALLFLVFLIAGIIGYGINIYRLFADCDFDSKTSFKCEVLRTAGVPIMPLGAFIGWMDLGE